MEHEEIDIPGPPTHMIVFSVFVTGAEEWTKIFGQFCELAENLGPKYPSLKVSSHQYEPTVPDELNETYSEDTLFKVQDALSRAGMPLRDIAGAISEMQNRGILFRERA